MPWFLLSPGVSILDSGIQFSIHPAATPNPESAENRLAAGVGRARRWLPRSMGHHPTLPPPARLRIPANGSYSRIGKALHDRAHRAGPQAEKDDRVPRRHGRARAGGGGAPGAGRRGQTRADRRQAGQRAGGRVVCRSDLKKTIAFPEGTDARVLEAAARLAREGVVKPVLIGARPANAPEGVEFVDPANSPLVKRYAELYYERRRAKGITQVEAAAVAK